MNIRHRRSILHFSHVSFRNVRCKRQIEIHAIAQKLNDTKSDVVSLNRSILHATFDCWSHRKTKAGFPYDKATLRFYCSQPWRGHFNIAMAIHTRALRKKCQVITVTLWHIHSSFQETFPLLTFGERLPVWYSHSWFFIIGCKRSHSTSPKGSFSKRKLPNERELAGAVSHRPV